MTSYTEIIGLSAGFLIAFGLVPQVLRVWRLRDAQEISLTFNLLSVGGTALWFTYGLSLGLLSVIIWNGVNLILYVSLLAVKLKLGLSKLPRQPPIS
jgi:MtN3 and saliva related transmembrane protein